MLFTPEVIVALWVQLNRTIELTRGTQSPEVRNAWDKRFLELTEPWHDLIVKDLPKLVAGEEKKP